jgi:hypothetical protein
MRASIIVIAALLLAFPAAAPAAKAPRGAIRAAELRAQAVFDVPERPRSDFSLRSRRNRSWALVTGGGSGRVRLWAAWARRTKRGAWKVRYFRTRNFEPGRRVPCDIRPAFSEPSC